MAYNNVHIPVGYEVAIKSVGDPAWVDAGVTADEATLNFTYDQVKVSGSQAESILNYAKNMILDGGLSLYQQDLRIVSKFLGGISEYSVQAGTPVAGATQTELSGAWAWNAPILIDNQNYDGSINSINSVTGGTDGLLVDETDYYIGQDVLGRTVITIIDSATVTIEAQDMVIDYDHDPAASRTITAGSASVTIVPYQIRIRKQLETGKWYTMTIHAAVDVAGLSMTMPRYDADEPNKLVIEIQGQLDVSRTPLDQLFSIVDEFGVADNNDG